MRKQFLIWLHVLVSFSLVSGQEQTVGLFLNDSKSFNGYTLFSGLSYTSTYLIDNSGLLVNSWESDYVPPGIQLISWKMEIYCDPPIREETQLFLREETPAELKDLIGRVILFGSSIIPII